MTENTTPETNGTQNAAEKKPGKGKQLNVNVQYIKDFSFENPKAPASLTGGKEAPKIDVAVDVKAGGLGEDLYEVVLGLHIKSTRAEEPLFIIELSYAGVFTLKNIPEEEREAALLIFCPSLLFPFARQIITDATINGGYPPLMLDPIDFARLFAQRKQKDAA